MMAADLAAAYFVPETQFTHEKSDPTSQSDILLLIFYGILLLRHLVE